LIEHDLVRKPVSTFRDHALAQVAHRFMTSPSDHPPPPDPNPAPEPVGRSGSIVLVLLVAGAIVAAAVAFMLLGKTQAQPYILGLLAVLAMVGLFGLFAFAAGIIRVSDRSTDNPIMRPTPTMPSTASR